jgi:2'-5' RNA ligase
VSDLEKFPPFPISPGLAGCFPNIQHPKVVWIGLNESKSLAELAKQVRISCGGELKDLDNKPFAPHLTLGRVRMGATPGFLSDWMKGYGDLDNNSLNPGAIVQHVDSVILYKSELKPQGPNYSELAIIPLMK